jgi:hypothetical protein
MKSTLTFLLIIGMLVFTSNARSQTLSPTVISSSGGFYSSASGSLSFTVAEMTMVKTFTGSNNILTQGFQQPEDFSTSITENDIPSEGFLIYPNPTNGQFSLSFSSSFQGTNIIKLYNLVGQVILEKEIEQLNGINTVEFNINSLSQGIYVLELTADPSSKNSKPVYQKINLVY